MKTGETKSIVEMLLKLKVVGYFLLLWGLTFFFWGIADLTYYAFNFNTATTGDILQAVLYIIGDITYISAGITLWVISSKIRKAKSQPAA